MEVGCFNVEGINFYQYVVVDIDGGDYFVINFEFISDLGCANEDFKVLFYEGLMMKFLLMVFDGNNWSQKFVVVVDFLYEGDLVFLLLGKMVISCFVGLDGKVFGYMICCVQVMFFGESYDVNICQVVQFFCLLGVKVNILFDECFFVMYVYENEMVNIYLIDIFMGEMVKVIEMFVGIKVFFLYFCFDGWFYFLVKGGDGDCVFVSDVVLRMFEC